VKLYAEQNQAGHLIPRLDPPLEALEIFLAVEVPGSRTAQYVLDGLDQALATGDGCFRMAFNVIVLDGDRSVVQVAEDDTFVPDAKRGQLPTPEFRRLLSEWVLALKAHGL
jgi:hypothetical protein